MALALVLVALLVTTAKVGLRKPRRVAHAESDGREGAAADNTQTGEEAPTAPPHRYLTQSAPRPAWRPAPAPGGGRERTVMAHLHGHVLPPPGANEEDLLDGLEVVADDGSRTVTARLAAGGRFAFHLPRGRYTLSAQAEDFSGATPDVPALADDDHEVDIQLGPAATIGGNLTAPENADITLLTSPVGSAHTISSQSLEPGEFSIGGLIPGRRYDLIFSGPTIRKTTLRSIVAPTDVLQVALAPLPIVRGAIGFLQGDTCPIETVSLRGAGLGDDAETEVDADCRFELTPPEGASELTVVAEGPGFYLEQSVSIPAQGDPDPICLNPPCPAT